MSSLQLQGMPQGRYEQRMVAARFKNKNKNQQSSSGPSAYILVGKDRQRNERYNSTSKDIVCVEQSQDANSDKTWENTTNIENDEVQSPMTDITEPRHSPDTIETNSNNERNSSKVEAIETLVTLQPIQATDKKSPTIIHTHEPA